MSGIKSRVLSSGLLVAVLAFAATILLDLTHVFPALRVAPRLLPGAVATAVELGGRFLWVPLGYACVTACLLSVDRSAIAPWARRALSGLHDVAAVATCHATFRTLGAYEPFLTFWPAMVGLAAVVVGLCLAFRAAVGAATPGAVRCLLGAGSALGFVALALVDRYVYPGLYPTLHLAFLELALLSAFVSGSQLSILWSGRAVVRTLAWFSALALCLGAAAVVAGHGDREARSLVRALTVLGQAPEALRVAPSAALGREVAVHTGPWAEPYFVEHCGLPRLPADFSVEDHDVILITVEATRRDYTSLAHPEFGTTPNLLAFARSGAFEFARAYSPSSGTLHSMSAVHAMSHPSTLALRPSARPWWGELDESETTVAELFSAAGRTTFWVGHDVENVFTLARIKGLGQGFDRARTWHAENEAIDADHRIAVQAEGQLKALRGGRARYFGWIFLESPHAPYMSHEPGTAPTSGTDAERYRSELRYADAQVGLLLDGLRKSGALGHTVVIVAGDHGEEFRDHGGTRHKATVYEEVIRVPLLVWIPGLPGSRVDEPTSLTYLFPWLLRTGTGALRDGALRRIQGTLAPMMRATGNAVVSELIGHDRMHTALVYGRYKANSDLLARYTRVFDLTEDPGERRDLLLAGSKQARTLLPHLEAYLNLRHTLQRYRLPPPEGSAGP